MRGGGPITGCVSALIALAMLVGAGISQSATPPGGTLRPDANGAGSIGWTGIARTGSAANTADEGESCFGADRRPSGPSGCDLFRLDVTVPADFYRNNPGSVQIDVGGFGVSDLDLYVYKRNPDGTRGDFVAGDGQLVGLEERVAVDRAEGAYYVAVVPYTVLG
ncbi:MAG: hypothetical protein H0U24_03440, partial [Thermoleophilaceae bacterium]|nr:hypothetical protein [Thermoleophilaceae bacterium]